MTAVNVSVDIINELSIIFLWVGTFGILDQFTHLSILEKYRTHINVLLILIAIYIKL
jgi:hypothetical protein